MGFFDKLKNAFSKLFGRTSYVRFDDTEILVSVRNYPQALPDNYKKCITEIAEHVHQAYAAANNKEFTIGVIGDFTVGKSSFVNAILGDRILPVSTNPSTAVITKIKYGSKPKVVIKYNDGNEQEMRYEDFWEFSAFNLNDFQERADIGEIQRFKNVVDAVMFVKSEFLKVNNLCIVDTLGLFAHESDNNKTIASIRDSIATIYICGERGLSDKDVNFISTYLSPEKDDFFLCINRIDLVKKNERKELSDLVKLKMDSILNKAGHIKKFPLSGIYQLSSLYQEFANGFTDHEDWREGVDYQERSGFTQMMNDVCKYVEANADVSRKGAINKQLQIAQTQLTELMVLRKNELDNQIASNNSKISVLEDEIRKIAEDIAYVETLFDTLYNTLRSFSNNVFDEFVLNVNDGWVEILNNSLVNKVSFGFVDYLTLKKDIMVKKLNIFSSSSDTQYIKTSLSPFIDLTVQILEDKLQPIINQLEQQITNTINKFAVDNSLIDFFDENKTFDYYYVYHIVERSNVVAAMYRTVALEAVESMFVWNDNRRIKMFDAAKEEALKRVESPLKENINRVFECIREYLNTCTTKAINANETKSAILTQQLKFIEEENLLLIKQMEEEEIYFNNTIDSLKADF
ncbi:MAG: dynamin family protein [Prevotella sp.]|nr:dynamin family protein [Prevotella sp.]